MRSSHFPYYSITAHRNLNPPRIMFTQWRTSAEAAVKNTPDLKQLQQLIATGEALPVSFPSLLQSLQTKLKQAEVWVERVRSAVPRQNRTRNKVCLRLAPKC